MRFLRNAAAHTKLILIMGDLLIAFIAVYIGIFIYTGGLFRLQGFFPFPQAVTFSIIVVFMSFFVDVYHLKNQNSKKEILLKIMFAGFFSTITLATLYYFIPSIKIGRTVFSYALCVSVIFQLLWHIGYWFILRLNVISTRVLILGTGPIAQTMGDLLLRNNNGLALAGYVNCLGEPIYVPRDNIIGKGEGLLDIALKEKVQQIVVSLSERRGTLPVREVLNCKLQGINIIDGPSFYEMITGKLLIENINPSHLIFSEGFRLTAIQRYLKRIVDTVFAVLGIMLSIPLLLIIPVLIKIDSKGPVFFKQKRVGEYEKKFTLYKFRTMLDDAEKNTGPVWSKANDSRITRLGKFLRKTRLDEIPQLFNVIWGDMSFIGPRPERPFFVESLKKQIPYYSERHCIKPGITGWAQVRYEYGDSVEDAIEKLRYDLYYIKYQSISLDMLILLDTVKVVFWGKGGR
jgi:sugar transferase (PEP-CTERM system associated)